MARFSSIPATPLGVTDLVTAQTLNALRENVELLTGQRGDAGQSLAAVLKSSFNRLQVPNQRLVRVSAQGAGFSIGGQTVPSLTDYSKLISDVQTVAEDVTNLRRVIIELIQAARG